MLNTKHQYLRVCLFAFSLCLLVLLWGCGNPSANTAGNNPNAAGSSQGSGNNESAPNDKNEDEASEEPIVLRAASAWADTDEFTNAGFFWLQEKVKEKSEGKLTIESVGGPEVFPPFELHEAVRNGVVDLAWATSSYYMSALPEAAVFGYSPLSAKEMRESGAFDYINEIHKQKLNVHVLGLGQEMEGCFCLYLKSNPIDGVDDLENMKLRASPVVTPFVKNLGAAPISMPGGEIYTALERNVIDGYAWPAIGITAMGFEGQTKYKIKPPFFRCDTDAYINVQVWEKLPAKYQQILEEAMMEVETEYLAFSNVRMAEEESKLKELGIEVIELTEAEQERYLQVANEVGMNWIRENVADNPEKLVELFW